MARIPVGNFGNMTPQGTPAARLNPGAFITGNGLEQTGNTLMRVAGAGLAEERQQQAQVDAERERLIQEAIKKDQQETAALRKAQAGNVLLDYEVQYDAASKSIEEQVNSGQLKYSEAIPTFNKTIEKIGMPDLTGYDPVEQENLTKAIRRLTFKGQQAMYKVQQTGKQGELRSQTDQMFDTLGKAAGLPGANMSQIIERATSMDAVGQQAYGAAWGKKKQDWIDNTWDAHLNQQAMAVRNDVNGINALSKEITQGQYADKLDSNRRNTLVAKLDGYKTSLIQRNEAAASRAQREQERYLNKAEAAYNTFQSLADKGTILSGDYVNQVMQQTAGTPYQQGIVALQKQAQETGGLAAQPIPQQKQQLAAIDAQIAKTGRTPELDKRREQISKVYTASQADLQKDGIRAGLERGVITGIEPLDTSSPAAMTASIAKRVKDAETVSMWAGGKPVSPLDSDEASQVRAMLEVLPPKERSQAIATITQTVGTRIGGAIAQQIDKQNRPLALAFATASSKTTAGRYTSELILSGDQALKDGVVMKDDAKVTGTKAMIAQEVDGVFPNAQLSQAVKDSAYYIAAGMAKENSGSISPKDVKKAVQLAIGGDIIEHNGKRIPIPAGFTVDDLQTRLKNISVGEIINDSKSNKPATGSDKWIQEHRARGADKKADQWDESKDKIGQYGKGNIDLNNRKIYVYPEGKNKGSYSSLESIGINVNNKEYLIPTVVDGQLLTEEDAVKHFKSTREYLGVFDTPEEASKYAIALEKRQHSYYTYGPGKSILDAHLGVATKSDYKVRAGGIEIGVDDFIKSLPGQELMPAGPGQYAVIVQGRPVTNTAGKRIIIKVQ